MARERNSTQNKKNPVIRVALKERSYDVSYLPGIGALKNAINDARGKEFALIDANVDRLHGKEFRRNLKGVHFIRIASGEKSKSFLSLERIANELVKNGATRSSRLIAIGGGVVGDLTGFLAGVFMRGIPFLQIPTTLLAMVDSSVGGKTAVNLKAGKNLVGVFHQPQHVFVIPGLLSTLPERELKCGLSESVKTALIADAGLVRFLEDYSFKKARTDLDFLQELSAACIAIKADIVSKDEREENIRAYLNFGHTLGHAIEARLKYKGILHGLAVAVGQRFAALVSHRLGYLEAHDELRIHDLLKKYELPATLRDAFGRTKVAGSELIRYMRADKKNKDGHIRFVLLDEPGVARLPENVSEQELLASLKEFQSVS